MYRRYYSYNDMPQLPKTNNQNLTAKPVEKKHIKPKKEEIIVDKKKEECKEECIVKRKNGECPVKNDGIGKILGRFELDDIILGVLILVLLMDDCDDNMLLLAIAFIFLTGIFDE